MPTLIKSWVGWAYDPVGWSSGSEFSGAVMSDASALTLPRSVALARGRQGTVLAAVLLAGFGGLFTLVRANRSLAADLAITIRVQRFRSPGVAHVMETASWLGFPPQSRIVPPAIALGLWLARLRTEALFALLAWGTAFLSTMVKAVMRRPRPENPSVQVTVAKLAGTSFPSGHTLAYVGVYGFLAYLAYTLLRPALLRRPIVALLCGLVAIVGPSRVYAGHHWPTDVLASYFLGFSYLIGLTALYRQVKAWQTQR
ncbi:MAG TPA: phosphatase PAP2 family protein [Chloroflexota bacterium]